MSVALIDDHLLRDVLSGDRTSELVELQQTHDLATTNFYYLRLCKSVVSAKGGALTGSWTQPQREQLGRLLVALPTSIHVEPFQHVAFRTAQIQRPSQLSTLGAEAIAAAEAQSAVLCVWSGDDGPRIRQAATAHGVAYRTLP